MLDYYFAAFSLAHDATLYTPCFHDTFSSYYQLMMLLISLSPSSAAAAMPFLLIFRHADAFAMRCYYRCQDTPIIC